MITNIYIDGFNFYYRAVKGTGFKWLNLHALCSNLLPTDQINDLNYFTARVSARPSDPAQPQRQATYIRALETLPNFHAYWGHFMPRKKQRPLIKKDGSLGNLVWVQDTEEKGSDVNLASRLVIDACQNRFDKAVVISNDSDLALPIELVRKEYGLPVLVANPDRTRSAHVDLKYAATGIISIWKSHLRVSLFPNVVIDGFGKTITKPSGW